LTAFELLKIELEHVALTSLEESVPFVDECDASDAALPATLKQRGRPVASRQRVALSCVQEGVALKLKLIKSNNGEQN